MNLTANEAVEIEAGVSETFADDEPFEFRTADFPAGSHHIRTLEQLNDFVERNHEGMQRLVRSQCFRTPEQADEAFQNLYPKLVQFLATSPQGIREPWAFIRVAARRAAIDELRRVATLSRRFLPLYEDSFIPTTDQDVGQSQETEQLAQAVRYLLATLDDREQAVLTGIFFQEKSGRDVAREMQLSESYVAEIKARALSHLRELLLTANEANT